MKDGSHSRHSYPMDKRVPKMEQERNRTTPDGYKYKTGYNSIGRKVVKKMHNKKQRQHNRKVIVESLK